MSIKLGAMPTVPALLSLIHALRAVKIKIILFQPDENDGTRLTQSKVCIRPAQTALSTLESEKQKKGTDCPCIECHSMRNRACKTVSCFVGFPRPTLLRQLHIPGPSINVYLFTYR